MASEPSPLYESRSQYISRENFTYITASLLRITNLSHAAAARYIRDASAVADNGNIRIKQRPNDKIRTKLHIQCSRRSIDNRACAQNHSRQFRLSILHKLSEHLVRKVSPVRKFKGSHASVIAGLEDFAGNLNIRMIKTGIKPYLCAAVNTSILLYFAIV